MPKAVLFSLDGVRPDGLELACTPNFDRLQDAGAYCPSARTVMPSSTLPCHTSMFRGVTPQRHGITTNTFVPMVRPIPSILDLAHQAKLKTASFYNWEELRDLGSPGSLNTSFYKATCDGALGDIPIAEAAAKHLREESPDFTFIYFGNPDVVGHNHGWMSKPYIESIGVADRALGIVLAAIDLERTLVIILSDHGGHERTHGTDAPEDMTIPWLAHGPGALRGAKLEGVQITDTAPTLAKALGIAAYPDWEGKAR